MPRLAPMIAALIVALLVSACAGPTPGEATDGTVRLEPCRLHGASGLTSVPAECGWLTVAENPADNSGNTIDLFIARIRALNQQLPSSAFTVLAGGPGQAATEFYADYAGAFARVQRRQDIILVDQRGTGQSARLDCEYSESDTLEFTPEYSASLAADCLDKLTHDPRFFTTSVAAGDLDRVREALGYRQLDLYGVSYGTRMAQHYLKRYPDQVRTVVIDGVVPAETVLGPGIAVDAQAALQKIFSRCADDEHCSSHFPDVAATFAKLAETLRAKPLQLTLPSPLSGEQMTIPFDYNTFAGAVRLLSYSPSTTALLPLLLHEAGTNENWAPLAAQAQMTMMDLADAISEGMHNAIVCTEDVPFFALAPADRAALADTYLGDLQVASLEAICAIWPSGIIDAGFHDPVVSDVPVMLLSGTADPVTPPRNGDTAAAHLTNSRHIIAEGHGHGVLTRGCVPELIAGFIETASFNDLDTRCVDREQAAPFFTSFAGPEP